MSRDWRAPAVPGGSTEARGWLERAARGVVLGAACWVGVLGLPGCASTHKEQVLPEDGPTMKQIYDRHFEAMRGEDIEGARERLGQRVPGRGIGTGDRDLYGYTREAQNEIEGLFPRLPNPTLVMYVFPHLSGEEGAPVPGYATSFPLYPGVEYALPGEVEVR